MARPPRKYAAYHRKRGTRRWKRLHPGISGSKDCMVRTYQNWLISGFLVSSNEERIIRPIPRKKV